MLDFRPMKILKVLQFSKMMMLMQFLSYFNVLMMLKVNYMSRTGRGM